MALKSAKESRIKSQHEVAGWVLLTMLMMALMIASLYIWVRDFAGSTHNRLALVPALESLQQHLARHNFVSLSAEVVIATVTGARLLTGGFRPYCEYRASGDLFTGGMPRHFVDADFQMAGVRLGAAHAWRGACTCVRNHHSRMLLP